jgi:nitrogen fixation protein FixH
MKKIFNLLVSLLLLGTTLANAENVQSLIINGETVAKTVAKITFDGDNVVLYFSDTTQQSADMGGVVITFADPTAIQSLTAFQLKGIVNGQLNLQNVREGATINVYDAAGRQVVSTRQSQIDLSRQKAGVYVLKVDNHVVKFVKR